MKKLPALSLLRAFKLVSAPWPDVSVSDEQSSRWPMMGDGDLEGEWARCLARCNAPGVTARLFYKHVPEYTFAGGNLNLAKDSTLPSVEAMLGKTDFDPAFPWARQAAWYRRHDEELVRTRGSQLDILERQDQADGTAWLHTGKTAIFADDQSVIGILGMYEVLDNATGTRMALARTR